VLTLEQWEKFFRSLKDEELKMPKKKPEWTQEQALAWANSVWANVYLAKGAEGCKVGYRDQGQIVIVGIGPNWFEAVENAKVNHRDKLYHKVLEDN